MVLLELKEGVIVAKIKILVFIGNVFLNASKLQLVAVILLKPNLKHSFNAIPSISISLTK